MTRILSQLLEASEPKFRQTLNQLEKASGNSNHDIRLTEMLLQSTRHMISQLQLDPDDTTAEELYHALIQRLANDDATLIKKLRTLSADNYTADAKLSAGMALALNRVAHEIIGFSLKPSSLRRIISKCPPKKTMKLLGYRSMASLLKHESLALIIAMALCYESSLWQKAYHLALSKTLPSDCESRPIQVLCVDMPKRQPIILDLMRQIKQPSLNVAELSTVVLLVLPDNKPKAGLTTATIALALNDINHNAIIGTYLKVNQVSPDFGNRFARAVTTMPCINMNLLNTPISWEVVQRFCFHTKETLESYLPEHIGVEDIAHWHPIEYWMEKIAPSFDYWLEGGSLAKLDGRTPISFNMLDNALSLCNQRKYGEHQYHHFQHSLWQDLLARYVRPDILNQAINQELQSKLAYELAS